MSIREARLDFELASCDYQLGQRESEMQSARKATMRELYSAGASNGARNCDSFGAVPDGN
jgi:hypothetical protein